MTLLDGREIDSSVVVWTGGVCIPKVVQDAGFRTAKSGRVVIDEFCQARGFPNVYVVGDCALIMDPENKKPLSQSIQMVNQIARVAAANILASLQGGRRKVLRPKFRGEFVSVDGYYLGFLYGLKL